MRHIFSLFTSLVLIGSGAAASAQANDVAPVPPLGCEQLLFATGYDGSAVSGSKRELIEWVQSGRPVRIGWARDFDKDGAPDLSHWAEASFLTIFRGEVSTQVEPIHVQHPGQADGMMQLGAEFLTWTGLIGTDGRLRGRVSSMAPNDPQPVATAWCGGA